MLYAVLNLNKDEKKVFDAMRTSMELMLELLQSTEDKNLKIVGAGTIRKNYSENSSFCVIVPAKEKFPLKICHGSHRVNYGSHNEGMYATVHRKMVSEVFIPENCMMVLDERLLHAGTESLLCGSLLKYYP